MHHAERNNSTVRRNFKFSIKCQTECSSNFAGVNHAGIATNMEIPRCSWLPLPAADSRRMREGEEEKKEEKEEEDEEEQEKEEEDEAAGGGGGGGGGGGKEDG